jgi:GT2 family glycosyltransferase
MGPQVADAPRPDVICLTGNLGFAAANNLGIAACRTEFVWLLNPDAFPHPQCLEHLLAAAARHPTAIAFGSRQMIDGRPDIIDGIGDAYGISGLGWRRRHGRRLRPADLIEREIFSPCAAAALYRRAAVVEVGGFDEDFFCYFEDVDLGFRLRLAGHRAISVPDAVVDHVGGVSSGGRRSAFATYHGHRNLVWAFAKNMPLPLAILLLPLHLLQTLASLAVCAARGEAVPFLRAKWDAIRGLPRMLAKRRGIQTGRRVSSWDVWQALAKRPWRE